MKNNKALFLIILGSFLLVTGFAFAGSYDQLKDTPFRDGKATGLTPIGSSLPNLTLNVPKAPAPAPAPAPKPTFMDKVKEVISDNARNVLLGGIGAYIGFVLFGPVGLVLGGLAFLALGTL